MTELAELRAKAVKWLGTSYVYMVAYTDDGSRLDPPRIRISAKIVKDSFDWDCLHIIPDEGEPEGFIWSGRPLHGDMTVVIALEREDGTEIYRGPVRLSTVTLTPGSMISVSCSPPIASLEGLIHD